MNIFKDLAQVQIVKDSRDSEQVVAASSQEEKTFTYD